MRIVLLFTFLISSTVAFAQQTAALPDAPLPVEMSAVRSDDQSVQTDEEQIQAAASSSKNDTDQQNGKSDTSGVLPSQRQPKRILGIMPNYRAVSAGEIPPPPTPKQAFVIATRNSFDYSSFIFVSLTSMIAEGQDTHPELGKGIGGFWSYSWRGFLDKTDGNYMVLFALPTVFHEDGRYFAKGKGGIFKRAVYASSRVIITRNYSGDPTFNASEIFGRAAAQGISTTYYPSGSLNASSLGEKYGYALMRDAITFTFREFWPDIATHVLHRHP